MLKEVQHIIILLKRLAILLLLYSLCRALFYFFNADLFPPILFSEGCWIFIYGIRYDVSAIIVLNSLFIVLHLLPNKYWETKFYQTILKIFFYLVNIVALIFEASDFAYFKYSFKRITSDIVFMEHDAPTLMPAFIRDFWYLLLMVVSMFLFAEFLYRKTFNRLDWNFNFRKFSRVKLISTLLVVSFLFIAARGNISKQSLTPNSGNSHFSVSLNALAQNTSFTLLYSLKHKKLEEKKYLTDEKANQYCNIIQSFNGKPASIYNPEKKKLNVVVIILESFSREYSGFLNGNEGYMPFLDSLMQQGMVFTNGWANGKKSIEGIPAVLSSVPGLVNEPLLNYGSYPELKMNTIATYLKEMNYSTAFFHGGSNGTMNFDKYILNSGFDKYLGKNEYPNQNDDDKVWGIFDEPFFQYFNGKLNEMQQPFLGAIFSLTSHHPFTIPSKYNGKFKQGKEPIVEVIQYTDLSLRQFFKSASQQLWYSNTLFVITADHTGPTSDEFYKTRVGMYRIPIVLFQPGNNLLKGRNDEVVQQTDILPTVLNYVGYDKSFISFGHDMFSSEKERVTVISLGNIFQIMSDRYSLLYDGEKPVELYDYIRDPLLKNNLVNEQKQIAEKLTTQIEAYIQVFNSSIIHNTLSQR